MSDTSNCDNKKSMEQSNHDLSKAMRQLSVNSDKISTPPKNLSDMPVDVGALIIQRSKYKQQLILRKVSKPLRELVDKQKPTLKSLSVSLGRYSIRCLFDENVVEYLLPGAKDPQKYSHLSLIMNHNYEKIAFDDLASTLKNPKLHLEYFQLESPEFRYVSSFEQPAILEMFKQVTEVIKSINHQISVTKARIDIIPSTSAFAILPYLKPGVLKHISIFSCYGEKERSELWETMEQVALLDQWKQAEELILGYSLRVFPMKYTTHFKRFFICEERMGTGSFERFRDFLCKLKNFEYCRITIEGEYDAMDLHYYSETQAAPNDRTEYVSHYSIPDSDDYLEVMFFKHTIDIERKKRSS